MDDLGLDAKDGRPVDPQVPGTVQDMDAAVAALLAKHDATRTDGKKKARRGGGPPRLRSEISSVRGLTGVTVRG